MTVAGKPGPFGQKEFKERPSSYLRCKAGIGLLAACNAASVPTMAADGRRHVIAIGGGMLVPDDRLPVHMDYALQLTGRAEPRICVLNTANGDDPRWALRMYDRFAGRPVRLSHLAL